MSRMQDRIEDYLAFGVRYVWLIDPSARRAWIYVPGEILEVRDRQLRTANPDIIVPFESIFPS